MATQTKTGAPKIGGAIVKLNDEPIPHGDCFLVIAPNFYGYGNSIKDAKAKHYQNDAPQIILHHLGFNGNQKAA